MLTKSCGQQLKLHCATIEDLVPADHFLRKLDSCVDFSFIYDEVWNLYSANCGRPGTDEADFWLSGQLGKYQLRGQAACGGWAD